MLETLRVHDIALIEEASLDFHPGFTVLTGETGAGKTALLSALKLLIGERADAAVVRDGAAEARVEAVFTEGDGSEHIVRRRLTKDGRSRCFLDDDMVTVGSLAETIGPLVDLHGQHDHQSLLNASVQLQALDSWIGEDASAALSAYQDALAEADRCTRLYQQMSAAARASVQNLETARFICQEIGAVDPQPGEYEQLEADLPRLRNGEALAQAADSALNALRSETGGMADVASATYDLQREAGVDPALDALTARMEELSALGEDLAQDLRAYRDSIDFDPHSLQEALDRLGQLEGLCKRFGPRMEDVFQAWSDAEETLNLAGSSDEHLEEAQRAAEAAEAELQAKARVLEDVRAAAVPAFSQALMDAVAALSMEGASFSFQVSPLERGAWTQEGPSRYEILYSPAPTVQSRPLARIASGGELSRVMLALKGMLRAGDSKTLVFDEIDTGIGGATANAIAARLAELACSHQVVVVTHLAQIAAVADRHYVIEKTVGAASTHTELREVAGEERVSEIARMLSGTVDGTSLAHARQLLG